MTDDRREPSTADLARPVEAQDRGAAERPAHGGHAETRGPEAGGREMLFPNDHADRLRADWAEIQAAFVDAPRDAVQQADALVAHTMKRIAEVFAAERQNLEQQWDRGDNVTTEDLRVALQRYRSFFDRLLSL